MRGYVAVVLLSGKVWIDNGRSWKGIEVPRGSLWGMARLNVVIVKGYFNCYGYIVIGVIGW